MLYWISITSSYYLNLFILFWYSFILSNFLPFIPWNQFSFLCYSSQRQPVCCFPSLSFPSVSFPIPSFPFLSFYLFPPSILLFSTPYHVLPFCSLSYSISLFSLCLPIIHSTPLHSTPPHCTATFLFLPALITSWTSETWSQTTGWIFPWCAWHSKRVSCKRTGISLRTSSTRRLWSYTVVTSITSHNRTPRECWALES